MTNVTHDLQTLWIQSLGEADRPKVFTRLLMTLNRVQEPTEKSAKVRMHATLLWKGFRLTRCCTHPRPVHRLPRPWPISCVRTPLSSAIGRLNTTLSRPPALRSPTLQLRPARLWCIGSEALPLNLRGGSSTTPSSRSSRPTRRVCTQSRYMSNELKVCALFASQLYTCLGRRQLA